MTYGLTLGESLIFQSADYIAALETLEKRWEDGLDVHTVASELHTLNQRVNEIAGSILKGKEELQFKKNISAFGNKYWELQRRVLLLHNDTTILTKVSSSSSSSSSSSFSSTSSVTIEKEIDRLCHTAMSVKGLGGSDDEDEMDDSASPSSDVLAAMSLIPFHMLPESTSLTPQEQIEQASKTYEELNKLQTRMTITEPEDYLYTVPRPFHLLSDQVSELSEVILSEPKEELAFRKKFKACEFLCASIRDTLNIGHCKIAASIYKDTQIYLASMRTVPLIDVEQSLELAKRIADLRAVNKSLRADNFLNQADQLLNGEGPSKQYNDRKVHVPQDSVPMSAEEYALQVAAVEYGDTSPVLNTRNNSSSSSSSSTTSSSTTNNLKNN